VVLDTDTMPPLEREAMSRDKILRLLSEELVG
jgi:hypothetical protein